MISLADLAAWFFFSGIIMASVSMFFSTELPRGLNSAMMFLSQGLGAIIVYALH